MAAAKARPQAAVIRSRRGASRPRARRPARTRRRTSTSSAAVLRTIRVSPRKLDLVAATIRGKKASSAVNDLTFSKKRIAQDVKKALNSAIANAENNHNLDVDRLIVAEASVGKS